MEKQVPARHNFLANNFSVRWNYWWGRRIKNRWMMKHSCLVVGWPLKSIWWRMENLSITVPFLVAVFFWRDHCWVLMYWRRWYKNNQKYLLWLSFSLLCNAMSMPAGKAELLANFFQCTLYAMWMPTGRQVWHHHSSWSGSLGHVSSLSW